MRQLYKWYLLMNKKIQHQLKQGLRNNQFNKYILMEQLHYCNLKLQLHKKYILNQQLKKNKIHFQHNHLGMFQLKHLNKEYKHQIMNNIIKNNLKQLLRMNKKKHQKHMRHNWHHSHSKLQNNKCWHLQMYMFKQNFHMQNMYFQKIHNNNFKHLQM